MFCLSYWIYFVQSFASNLDASHLGNRMTYWKVSVILLLQVEHQYSHKFKVTVVRAEKVTKGSTLGDFCEFLHVQDNSLCPHYSVVGVFER